MIIEEIRKLIQERKYRLTLHAEAERDADRITLHEIEEAILSSGSKIVEDYPNDPRGHSCLILGFTGKRKPIHILFGLREEEMLILITVYRPDPKEWVDGEKRRGEEQ
jgi:hypothetical protein